MSSARMTMKFGFAEEAAGNEQAAADAPTARKKSLRFNIAHLI